MKNNLRFTFLLIAVVAGLSVTAQLTKLSNNTSLSGIVLGNNKPLMISDVDNTLWATDDTPAGTVKYTTKVITDTTDNNGGAGLLGGKFFFAGIDAANGSELWVTDGTDAGTTLVKDIEPGANSSTPKNFFPYNNQLFFFAQTAATGTELWKTDGTNAGTVLVKDINPGQGSSIDSSKYGFVSFFVNNGVAYFDANDGTHGNELWKTDGTAAGTVLVKDINAGAGNGIDQFFFFNAAAALGSVTLFSANNGTGSELWKTDGTEAGTVMVKDISSDQSGSNPNSFVLLNNKVYFDASTPDAGIELWVTDATAAGTTMVKDINPGPEPSIPSLFNSIIFGNRLTFSAIDSAHGTELWSTDGTAAGTVLLKDIAPGPDGDVQILPNFRSSDLNFSNFHNPPFNGKAFMTATTADNGQELWITDGSADGTVLVKDINPGAGDGFTGGEYYYTQNELFFSADDGVTGTELYKSDGTAAGTSLIKDINAGPQSSDPAFNFVFNNHLYLTANDGDNQIGLTDLYSLDENVTLPVGLYNFAATVHQSIAVVLDWSTTNEINSSHFDIERSADGINFSKIDDVKAARSSTVRQIYQYTDKQPAHLSNLVLFYRLKMVDKDASYKYSQILAVHFEENSFRFTFSPNPVSSQLSVVVAAGGSLSVALRITDVSGRQVYQQALSATQNIVQQNINVATWPKGIYYIQLISDRFVKSAKFIKQ